MVRWMMIPALVALVACGGDKEEDSGALATTDTAIGGTIPTDAPVLRNCEAVCRLNNLGGAGSSFFQWTAQCIYEDPQGNDTVLPFADVSVEQNGAVVANLQVVCGIRGDGTPLCDGAWGADDTGISCQSEPESYTWTIKIYDVDGNTGEAETTGRAEG